MVGKALQHRSGRIIALSRVVLALLFVLALWLDPAQPVRDSLLGYALLVGYLTIALAQLGIAWHDWWADYRLALPAFALDVLVFRDLFYGKPQRRFYKPVPRFLGISDASFDSSLELAGDDIGGRDHLFTIFCDRPPDGSFGG